MVLHMASIPQDPGHGSVHFSRIQAKLLEHSAFIVHSGLQCGGLPTYPPKHEQEGFPLISLQSLFAPHGDGLHGFVIMGDTCSGS